MSNINFIIFKNDNSDVKTFQNIAELKDYYKNNDHRHFVTKMIDIINRTEYTYSVEYKCYYDKSDKTKYISIEDFDYHILNDNIFIGGFNKNDNMDNVCENNPNISK